MGGGGIAQKLGMRKSMTSPVGTSLERGQRVNKKTGTEAFLCVMNLTS